jgi:hypothetical protein
MTVTEDGLPFDAITAITAPLDDAREAATNAIAQLPKASGERWRVAQARTLVNEAIHHLSLLLPEESA